ncbi:MAG TPA: hypothetical protein VGQ83_09025 [Polyangia bacterium]|jgi:hypothetical protein
MRVLLCLALVALGCGSSTTSTTPDGPAAPVDAAPPDDAAG